MIGTKHIFAILRLRRVVIGMLLVPMLVLNLIAASLGASQAARANAFDDIVARSRCLTSAESMLPEKAPAKSHHDRSCPACATVCTTGCCAGSALTGANIAVSAPQLSGGLQTTLLPKRHVVVPPQFRSSLRAQAPPRLHASQSFDA